MTLDVSDVHVPAWYHKRLTQLLRANTDPEKLAEMVRQARAHAGGMGKAAKRRMEMSEFRFFVELGDDGLTEWVQVIPGPGTWTHPRYGKLIITNESLERFVENFKRGVYQEHIPIDAEHKTKATGAYAYYREMKVGHDGQPGVWARLELTERGKAALDGGGFRYFSPEIYDEWQEPVTGQVYKDVVVGGAFTTRPFYKDSSLQPIPLSELAFCQMGMDMGDEGEGEEASEDLADIIIGMVNDGLTDAEIEDAVKSAASFARTVMKAYVRVGAPPPEPGGGMMGMGEKVWSHVFKASGDGEMCAECKAPKSEHGRVFKDVDPNVGGGVDRDKLPDDDFAGPNRSFPIVKPGDVSDAASSLGRAKGNPDTIKAAIIRIAKRKGAAFVAQLPEAWKDKQMTEEDPKTKTMAELEAENEALARKYAEQEAESKKLAERIATMESEAQVRRFTEIVTGKGGANDGGAHFFGEVPYHVGMLQHLARQFGEDSEQVKAYVEREKGVATAIATSEAMRPIGQRATPGGGATALEGLQAEIRAYAEKNNLDEAHATVQYLAHPGNRERYNEYVREQKRPLKE